MQQAMKDTPKTMANASTDISKDSSSTLNESDAEGNPDVTTGNNTQSYYSDHIATVCEAVNAEAKVAFPPYDMSQADRRRMTNRLSARRCRQRRKVEIRRMEEEYRRLMRENESLTDEKGQLQQVLLDEVSNASSHRASDARANLERLAQIQALTKVPPLQVPPEQQGREFFNPGGVIPSGITFQGTDPFAELLLASLSGSEGMNSHLLANADCVDAATLEILLREQNSRLDALLPTNSFVQSRNEAQLASLGLQGLQAGGANVAFSDPVLYQQWLLERHRTSPSNQVQFSLASLSSDASRRSVRNARG